MLGVLGTTGFAHLGFGDCTDRLDSSIRQTHWVIFVACKLRFERRGKC